MLAQRRLQDLPREAFLNQSGAPVAVEVGRACSASPSAQLFQSGDLVSVSVLDASGIIVKYREEFTGVSTRLKGQTLQVTTRTNRGHR